MTDHRKREAQAIAYRWVKRIEANVEDRAVFADALYRAGLTSALDAETELDHSHLSRILERVRPYVPDITLRLFAEVDLLDLGLIGYAVASSPSVGKGLEIAARYHDLTTDRFEQIRIIEAREVTIRPIMRNHYSEASVDIAEDCVMGSWRLLHLMLGTRIEQKRASAHFAYAEPAHGNSYRRYFDCAVYFDAPHSELRFPAAWLDWPIQSGNTALAATCAEMCERLIGKPQEREELMRDAVRRLLLNRPGRRVLRLEQAAEQLKVSPAQMRKGLYRDGTSYKGIVLAVRMDLARNYLEATALSVQEIAYLLDYSQSAPFSRAFKKHFGVSPQQWRDGNRTVEASVTR